ncbi:MAG: HesA/MoeB/ThiF family protein [Deferribacteraceae bacterium]|jgi:molybdopterin/thiamine biosynthesis adenylyltransferase|nr:HesA/MoeB/ThiF family protein [Deferribacteraceae bacterium]
MRDLNESEIERYSRHIILQDIGVEGQERICAGKVLVIGAGGLGSPVLYYLAAAGVGEIGIADGDEVDLSNLQRQILHTEADIGRAKTASAVEKLSAVNSNVKFNVYHEFLTAENILGIVKDYDFIIDGTDSFSSKFLINDACVLAKKPFSHGGILRFSGQTMTINPFQSACYACVFDAPPPSGSVPSCSQAGILGSVAGMLGVIQATEALKFLSGAGAPLYNAILSFDALTMTFRKALLKRNPRCRICGSGGISGLSDYEQKVCDL